MSVPAEAFVDTPNSVLRRLLLDETQKPVPEQDTKRAHRPRQHEVSSEKFVKDCMRAKFGDIGRRVGRYRMMLEANGNVVYFQNFNKPGGNNLWYRLSPAPLELMRSCGKRAWVCLTNPAEGFGFLIPLTEIDNQVSAQNWDRDSIEVNIDVADSRWREFDWRLGEFEFQLDSISDSKN